MIKNWTNQRSLASGGSKVLLTLYQDNVAATQTAVALLILGDAARTEYPPPIAGSVLAIRVYSNAARSAGTLTVDVTVDGVATGLQAILDGTNTTTKTTTQAQNLDAFTDIQRVGVDITTSADWAPTTADITVTVIVEM